MAQPATAVDFVNLLHVGEGGGADQQDGEAEEQPENRILQVEGKRGLHVERRVGHVHVRGIDGDLLGRLPGGL